MSFILENFTLLWQIELITVLSWIIIIAVIIIKANVNLEFSLF